MDEFGRKVHEFEAAMHRYHHHFFYKNAGLATSLMVIGLQILSVVQLCWHMGNTPIQALPLLLGILCAYGMADFVNGLAHMYMDNNTNYKGFFGPFVAAFHLHHVTPRYKERHPLLIYFFESGTKFWLVMYLIFLTFGQYHGFFSASWNFCLVAFGIFSCFAEVSHFWTHNSQNPWIKFLQKNRILLCKKHHMAHHLEDNKNYAFLNGLSDPVINRIAAYWYRGYKNHSDKHAKAYAASGPQSRNRPDL